MKYTQQEFKALTLDQKKEIIISRLLARGTKTIPTITTDEGTFLYEDKDEDPAMYDWAKRGKYAIK